MHQCMSKMAFNRPGDIEIIAPWYGMTQSLYYGGLNQWGSPVANLMIDINSMGGGAHRDRDGDRFEVVPSLSSVHPASDAGAWLGTVADPQVVASIVDGVDLVWHLRHWATPQMPTRAEQAKKAEAVETGDTTVAVAPQAASAPSLEPQLPAAHPTALRVP